MTLDKDTVRWERGSRFYSATLKQDLFKQWVVFVSWGSLVSRAAACKTTAVDSIDAGVEMVRKMNKIRLRRQYKLVSDSIGI